MSRDTLNEAVGEVIGDRAMRKYHICHVCGNRMHRCVNDQEYRIEGSSITVHDVEFFQCENCGESILESQEAQRVEDVILFKHKIK